MAAFEYQALDDRGRTVRGVITGDAPRQIRQSLREQGLTPLRVVGVRDDVPTKGKPALGGGRIRESELALITRQFATLVASGLTIEESLQGLIRQTEAHRLKTILSGVRSMVMEGHSLANAIAAYPSAFPNIYRASVDAGEQSGRLDIILERLADFTEARQGLRQRISLALIYPSILLLMSLAIIFFLFTYVVPKVVRVFEDTGQTLPLLTRSFIAITDFLQSYGIWLFAGIAILLAGFYLLFRQGAPRMWLHRNLLHVPWLRRTIRGINTTRMARTLSIMVGSGVPLLTAMDAASAVVNNLAIRQGLRKARDEVAEGVTLNRALDRTGFFPPILIQMVSSGEASGRLEEMLEKTAITQERELETRLEVMVSLFQPLMILIMGGIVLMIVLAILLPIFDINQLIG